MYYFYIDSSTSIARVPSDVIEIATQYVVRS
jgi:hypothetical protein